MRSTAAAVAELFTRGAELGHVPAHLQCHLCRCRRAGPFGELEAGSGVRHRRAVGRLLRATERDHDHVGQAVADRRRCVEQRGHARVRADDSHRVAQLERHVADRGPLQVAGGKVEVEPAVDIGHGQARVGQPTVERLHRQRQRGATEIAALLRCVHADDGDVSLNPHDGPMLDGVAAGRCVGIGVSLCSSRRTDSP